MLINKAISSGVTIEAPYITPAMTMMKAAKFTTTEVFLPFLFSIIQLFNKG
jgi:hypothetical protein